MSRIPRRVAAGLIRLYQLTLGRLWPGQCRFHPSCSEYAFEAIARHGVIAGGARAAWRVLRCGPWSKGGVDYPAPPRAEHPRARNAA